MGTKRFVSDAGLTVDEFSLYSVKLKNKYNNMIDEAFMPFSEIIRKMIPTETEFFDEEAGGEVAITRIIHMGFEPIDGGLVVGPGEA